MGWIPAFAWQTHAFSFSPCRVSYIESPFLLIIQHFFCSLNHHFIVEVCWSDFFDPFCGLFSHHIQVIDGLFLAPLQQVMDDRDGFVEEREGLVRRCRRMGSPLTAGSNGDQILSIIGGMKTQKCQLFWEGLEGLVMLLFLAFTSKKGYGFPLDQQHWGGSMACSGASKITEMLVKSMGICRCRCSDHCPHPVNSKILGAVCPAAVFWRCQAQCSLRPRSFCSSSSMLNHRLC